MNSKKTILYIARHGKTMFNTLDRVQGWADTPLTDLGAQDVNYLGIGLKEIPFQYAWSSDSGRAIQTTRIVLSHRSTQENIPYDIEPRIREWCFGSMEGMFGDTMWELIPRTLGYQKFEEIEREDITYEDFAKAIVHADTANWAEPYEQIKTRIIDGFTAIAENCEQQGGGNVFITSHGLTISHFISLIEGSTKLKVLLKNASITKVAYENGKFTLLEVNNTNYIEQGKLAHLND